MGNGTSISWTDATWNPIRGCRRTAPEGSKQSGCGDPTGGGCYAERQAARFCGPGGAYEGLITLTKNGPRWSGKTKFVAEHLADPLRWKKPRRIFVDSMSDLFYDGFTNEQIAAVFGVMAAAPQHTFQILTKRAKRMREWFEWVEAEAAKMNGTALETVVCWCETNEILRERNVPSVVGVPWPLPNVWLGVSCENQAAADERIPELLRTPAALRFLSCEPLIGPVRLHAWLAREHGLRHIGAPPGLGWIIVGCESGPRARECEVEWLRSLRDQCAAARVPVFIKQAVESLEPDRHGYDVNPDGTLDEPIRFDDGSKVKGRGFGGAVIELPYLDDKQHAEFPEVSP